MTDTKRIIFSEREKEILINLISPRIQVLESKNNDIASLKKKQKEWNKLTEAYNSNVEVRHCEPKQLRKCWLNIKARYLISFFVFMLLTSLPLLELIGLARLIPVRSQERLTAVG